ncbi:tomoregulin-1 isoform X3 [Rhinatrema bivittatum]|uniref:tomoregulin-1 isoform X3 n=1 Tax=Rhinatrema bivittatum TaxID=194408 RepID=UPI00112BDA05|nr:tomoregulin-1 isoform X3 [Rhinatrema bivittatum]
MVAGLHSAAAAGSLGPPALGYTWVFFALTLSSVPGGQASNQLPSECQHGKGKGINCSELNLREADMRRCDESSCKYGGMCKEDSDGIKCACQFQCHTNYIPVCGSNGDTYQNECFLRQAACKQQKDITVVARGPCYSDNGSGSGEGEYEGSGSEVHRKHSKCGACKYGAECDEDAEDIGCVCNIDCSGHNSNLVCASDGRSYNNPCLVREASCLRQEQIDVKHLGKCTGTDDSSSMGKKDDGIQYRPEVKDASDQREEIYVGNHVPCSETFNSYCVHGKCEFIFSTQKASCRKCPKNNRGRRQKQNLGHFTSDASSRMV